MLAGIAFPILLAVGTLMVISKSPDSSHKNGAQYAQLWLNLVNDKGHRTVIIIGCALMMLAALALIWFATTLRDRYQRGSGNPMIGFALVGAVGIAAAMVGPLAVTGGQSFGSDPASPDGTAVWFVFTLFFPLLFVVFGLASTAFIAALLLTARNALPTWLVVFGWIAALAGIVAVLFLPIVLVLLWYLALAIHGLVRPPAAPETVAA
jgi:MFS family permease